MPTDQVASRRSLDRLRSHRRRGHQLLLALLAAVVALALQPPTGAAAQNVTQHAPYRSIDGYGNNLAHPEWGAAGTPFVRQQVPTLGYNDTSSQLTGADRPTPRNISLVLMATDYPNKKRYTDAATSDMLTYIGQFIDHDLDKTADGNSSDPRNAAPIPIPKGDPYFDPKGLGNVTMPFTRSAYALTNGTSGYRVPINLITAFIDGSLVYGSSDAVSRALRTGTGGLLRLDSPPAGPNSAPLGPMLPFVSSVNFSTTYMANDANRVPGGALRAAGDVRGNVDPPVLSLQTLWAREHNRLAAQLAQENPGWDDEKLFQEARKWNIAYMQRVCFYEYIPALGIVLPPYTGYNASVNPGIDVFFSTVSYRYGHSEVTDIILRIDDEGNEVPEGHLLLSQAYFNPPVSLSAGIDPILRGLSMRVQGYVEPRFSQAVQNFLFGLPGVNSTDLFARNIQRGRDHGVPPYNTARRDLGLPPVATFANFTDDPTVAAALTQLYGTPDDCDAYVCGLAEVKLPGSHFGPLFNASLTDQYLRVRDGDWYYFENTQTAAFNESELAEIRGASLRDIILRNTNIKVLPDDIWHVNSQQPWPAASTNAASRTANVTDGTHEVALADGQYKLAWSFVPNTDPELAEITVTAPGSGWVGFGVADSPTSAMVKADIMMARVMPDGTAQVADMWATTFAPPQPDTSLGGSSDVQLVSASQQDGATTVTFRRPVAATDQFDHPLVKDGPNNLIFAWNPSTTDITQYHGPQNRGLASIALLASTAGGPAAVLELSGSSSSDYRTLRTHGILMAIAFALLLPLGALCNRAKNTAFLTARPGTRQGLFVLHVLFNASAAVLVAAALGLIFARVTWIDYRLVPYNHGKLGIAVAAMLFVQALYPWFRPAPLPMTIVRRMWELVHVTLGRAIIIVGLLNVAIGVHIITSMFGGNFYFFACLAAIPAASLALLGAMLDRLSWQSTQAHRTLVNDHDAASGEGLEGRESPGGRGRAKAEGAGP